METVNCNRASNYRQCVIDGEDDESPDIVISLQDAMKGVKKGDLIECIGCSTKKTRAFHTKESYPELFKKPKQAKKETGVNLKITDKLDDEKVELLVKVFIALRREYEQFRKNSSCMESGIQYNARMIEQDLLVRGYNQ